MSDQVQVALRIRPLIPLEITRGCKHALEVYKDIKQVRISDKPFTFNYIFDSDTPQNEFYEKSVEGLVPNLFKGYNVTILAYGQTGSGKTHSMGTAYNGEGEMGIIPRAVHDIFTYIKDNFSFDFNVTVSFVELYQEVLYDLLSSKPRDQCAMEIREDVNKGIFIPGLTEITTSTAIEVLDCLQAGSKGRATSSTNMNAQSSRSHAIFSIYINMTSKLTSEGKTAKFQLVDLAGSERPKKTGATGQTFKEGVNINKGLFVLGNVISALGDEKGAPAYVNYRESILTRFLKDSLGGNSITMMVACVSPADYNVEETLSTLRYADRAKRIKNKPIVNEDPKAAEINKLQKIIKDLKLQLVQFDGSPIVSQGDLNVLKQEISDLKSKLHSTVSHNAALHERILLIQNANEDMTQKLQTLQNQYTSALQNLNNSMEQNDMVAIKDQINTLRTMESLFSDIDIEAKKHETQIKNHERSYAYTKDNTYTKFESEEDIDQMEKYTSNQIAIGDQIQQVTKILAQKEEVAAQMTSNAQYVIDIATMKENESKILVLEKEKNELQQQLKNAYNQGSGGTKIAEQRRKRVQELESQMHELKRKVLEHTKLIKIKERDDLKIKQLNSDIISMKSEKIKLVKRMREESDRFRRWKLSREKDLSKLQREDRKRQNEIANMKRNYTLQEKVWKMKMEEAAANSKRLKDALSLRKNVQDSKLKGKVERLGPWVEQELTIHASLIAAKVNCKSLMDGRAFLQEQLDKLRGNNDSCASEEINKLEEQIELRTMQLQELQQKIIESDDDERSRTRFDNIQTMAEAKFVMKAMFDLIADFKKAELSKQDQIEELLSNQTNLQNSVDELRKNIASIEMAHSDAVSVMSKEHHETTEVLLKQMFGIKIEGLENITQGRIEVLENMIQNLEKNVESLQVNNEELQKTVEEQKAIIAQQGETSKYQTPPKRKKKSSSLKENLPTYTLLAFDDSPLVDDVNEDPDWRRTPLGKQVRSLQNAEQVPGFKRSVSGGCSCRTACKNNRCSCKKSGRGCSKICQCKSDVCCNRDEMQEEEADLNDKNVSDQEVGSEDERDTTFKKPRLTGENLELKNPILKITRSRNNTVLAIPED